MVGRGRGWRRGELTEPARKVIKAMRHGGEWHSTGVARATGLSASNAVHVLKRLVRDGLMTVRLESVQEHARRQTLPDERNKGKRRELYALTREGREVANHL